MEAGQGVHSSVEEGLGVFVFDGLSNTDFDTADSVSHFDHAIELNHGSERNAQAGELFNGENNTRKSAFVE